jgi:hypothetical protein
MNTYELASRKVNSGKKKKRKEEEERNTDAHVHKGKTI